jgi:pilus assembly protein Flp/PilA
MFAILLRTLFDADDGQGLVEYALIIALVALAAIVGLGLMGGAIADILSNIADELANPGP